MEDKILFVPDVAERLNRSVSQVRWMLQIGTAPRTPRFKAASAFASPTCRPTSTKRSPRPRHDNEECPRRCGNSGRGHDPEGIIRMVMIADKYRKYSTRVAADLTREVFYEECDGRLARFHARIYRIPSASEFTVRHMAGATAEDRRRAERILQLMPSGRWAQFPADRWFRHRNKEGVWYWVMELGRRVDDPLVQLELEMMIDLQAWAVDHDHARV